MSKPFLKFVRRHLPSPVERLALIAAGAKVRLATSRPSRSLHDGAACTSLEIRDVDSLVALGPAIELPELLPSLPHWSLREARGHWQVVFTQCQGMAYRLLWGQSLGPFATIESKASSFIFPSFVKRTHDVEGPPDLLATSVLSGSTLCLFRHDVTSWKMHELSENVERAHWIHSDGLDVVVFKRKAWGLANGASEMQGELYVAVLDQNLKMPITYKLPLDPVYDFDVQWVDGSIALFFAGPTSAGLRLLAPDWSIRSLGELDSNGIGQIFQPRLAVCGKQASLAYLERGADLTCLCIASLPLP